MGIFLPIQMGASYERWHHERSEKRPLGFLEAVRNALLEFINANVQRFFGHFIVLFLVVPASHFISFALLNTDKSFDQKAQKRTKLHRLCQKK